MRFLSALFFFFTFPVVIFLAAILFGGITSSSIKQELAKSNVYDVLAEQVISNITPQDGAIPDDATYMVTSIIKNRMTGQYLRGKTEKAIDDTTLWINGSKGAPVVSFSEIKNDINTQNPEFLPQIQQTIEEFKKQQGESGQDNVDTAAQANAFAAFIKNDFSMPVGHYLQSLKDMHFAILIALPLLTVLLVICILIIIFRSHSKKAKFVWLGVMFLMSALYGFIIMFGSEFIIRLLTQLLKSQTNPVVSFISPILDNLISLFITNYKKYQSTASGSLIAISFICFVGAIIFRDKVIVTSKKIKTKQK